MNKDEFAGQWQQIRGQAQQRWGKLTDDDLERVGGKWEQFVRVLQAKYGYTRETVEFEFSQGMLQFGARQKPKKNGGQAPVLDIVQDKWTQMRLQVHEWWGKLTDADLDKTAGKAEAVFGLLQAEYGFSRERAEAEFKRRVKEYEASLQEHPVPITYFR